LKTTISAQAVFVPVQGLFGYLYPCTCPSFFVPFLYLSKGCWLPATEQSRWKLWTGTNHKRCEKQTDFCRFNTLGLN